eukprot:185576-Alexandrium_andersonii.AAC.1
MVEGSNAMAWWLAEWDARPEGLLTVPLDGPDAAPTSGREWAQVATPPPQDQKVCEQQVAFATCCYCRCC